MHDAFNNDFIRKTIKEISDNEEDRLYTGHGFSHVINVANYVTTLCTLLSLSDKDAVTAAIVHDIGMTGEKEGHALRAYELLKENTSYNEKILQAVKNHSFLEEIYSYESAVLAICDKIDLDKRRILPLGKNDDFTSRILSNIEKTVLTAEGDVIVINYETSGPVDLYLYEKYFMIMEKAFKYLGVSYDVRLDNVSIIGGIHEA